MEHRTDPPFHRSRKAPKRTPEEKKKYDEDGNEIVREILAFLLFATVTQFDSALACRSERRRRRRSLTRTGMRLFERCASWLHFAGAPLFLSHCTKHQFLSTEKEEKEES